jgi:hypothetical protein
MSICVKLIWRVQLMSRQSTSPPEKGNSRTTNSLQRVVPTVFIQDVRLTSLNVLAIEPDHEKF